MRLTRRSLVLAGIATPLAAPLVARNPGPRAGPNCRRLSAGRIDRRDHAVGATGMQQRLGATIVIENRSGASGSIGTAAVVKSPPDGNTWLTCSTTMPQIHFCFRHCLMTAKGLDPVLLIGTAPYLITTAKARPYNTLADIIAFAKAEPEQHQLRLCRQRKRRPSCDGAAVPARRRETDACPLSRRRSGDE